MNHRWTVGRTWRSSSTALGELEVVAVDPRGHLNARLRTGVRTCPSTV
jgi:hypothetical protein